MRLTNSAVSLLILSSTSILSSDAFSFFTPFGLTRRTGGCSTTLDALYTPRTTQKPFYENDFEKCESSQLYVEAVKLSATKDSGESKKTTTQIPSIPFSVSKSNSSVISETFSNEFTKAVEAMQEKIHHQNAFLASNSSKEPNEPIEWSTDQPTSSFGMNGYSLKKESTTTISKPVSEIFRKKAKYSKNLPVTDFTADMSTNSQSDPVVNHDPSTDNCAPSADDWLNGTLSVSKIQSDVTVDDFCEIVENIYEDIYNEPLNCSELFPDEESVQQVPYYIADSDEYHSEHDDVHVEKKSPMLHENQRMKLQAVIENQKRLMELEKKHSSLHHRITAEDLIILPKEVEKEAEVAVKVSKQAKEKEITKNLSVTDSPVSAAISNQNQLLSSSSTAKRITAEDLISKQEKYAPQYVQESQNFAQQKKVEAFYNMDPITRLPQMVNLKHMNQYSMSSEMTSNDNQSTTGYTEQQMMSYGPAQHGYGVIQGYGGVSQYGASGIRSNTMMMSPQGDIVDLKFVGGNPGMSYGTSSSSRYNNSAGINIMGGHYRPGVHGYDSPSPFSMGVPDKLSNAFPYGNSNGYGYPAVSQGQSFSNGVYNSYGMTGMSHSNISDGSQSGAGWDSPGENKMILPQSVLGESGKFIFSLHTLFYDNKYDSRK